MVPGGEVTGGEDIGKVLEFVSQAVGVGVQGIMLRLLLPQAQVNRGKLPRYTLAAKPALFPLNGTAAGTVGVQQCEVFSAEGQEGSWESCYLLCQNVSGLLPFRHSGWQADGNGTYRLCVQFSKF